MLWKYGILHLLTMSVIFSSNNSKIADYEDGHGTAWSLPQEQRHRRCRHIIGGLLREPVLEVGWMFVDECLPAGDEMRAKQRHQDGEARGIRSDWWLRVLWDVTQQGGQKLTCHGGIFVQYFCTIFLPIFFYQYLNNQCVNNVPRNILKYFVLYWDVYLFRWRYYTFIIKVPVRGP